LIAGDPLQVLPEQDVVGELATGGRQRRLVAIPQRIGPVGPGALRMLRV
jgi:hypothetical protein